MKMEEKYLAISFNYMRYLHEHKNISWECAHYYSQLLQSYLFKYLDLSKTKPKTIFNFKIAKMDKIISDLTSSFIFSNFTKALAILNNWESEKEAFKKVMPRDYKAVLAKQKKAQLVTI